MNIKIDPHTLYRAIERGTKESEILGVIKTGFNISAKYDRKGRAKVYEYQRQRLNKYYDQKRVEVIYKEENDTIVTITVYVFYGKWEEQE